ncbi:MAG: hypothetical protein ACRERY_15870 [Pseudomonas sp.]
MNSRQSRFALLGKALLLSLVLLVLLLAEQPLRDYLQPAPQQLLPVPAAGQLQPEAAPPAAYGENEPLAWEEQPRQPSWVF